MSEWADIRANTYSEGWSGRGGQTRNSYNLTQDPAGSSSGPAHAVSANLVTIAIGTETDGSVIAPAQRAGIIGIKPTVGLTSRDGVIPEAHSQDTVGAFGKTFKDAAYVLTAIHGIDPRDNATAAQKGHASSDYSKFVSNSSALKGVRIGIPWKRVWESSTTVNQYPQLFSAIDQLRKAGAIIINNTNLPDIDEITPNPPGKYSASLAISSVISLASHCMPIWSSISHPISFCCQAGTGSSRTVSVLITNPNSLLSVMSSSKI